ncbi:hypothetical protein B296_00040845 [Ensete ventricosum]|uniref:Uncharacterized protein n=1 Tax=Ensete ventricosum TaxID=4639 RepID=A0A426YU69_ENSVE|nr:hypothetical protein B296_00040845 [Ensete ventricosum]
MTKSMCRWVPLPEERESRLFSGSGACWAAEASPPELLSIEHVKVLSRWKEFPAEVPFTTSYNGGIYTCGAKGGHTEMFNGAMPSFDLRAWLCVGRCLRWFPGPRSTRLAIVSMVY